MNTSSTGTIMTWLNCEAIAKAREIPSRAMRRQFHSTTSRGAYKVWDTAIAVNTAPNVPHAAAMLGGENHKVLARITNAEKQYRASAVYPPASPYKRLDTYHKEAPSNVPNNM